MFGLSWAKILNLSIPRNWIPRKGRPLWLSWWAWLHSTGYSVNINIMRSQDQDGNILNFNLVMRNKIQIQKRGYKAWSPLVPITQFKKITSPLPAGFSLHTTHCLMFLTALIHTTTNSRCVLLLSKTRLDLLTRTRPFSLNISQLLPFSKHDAGYWKNEDEFNTVHDPKQPAVKRKKEIRLY